MTSRQIVMFHVEDLPLFSGTAPRGEVGLFEGMIDPEPQLLPAECEFCRATGLVGLCLFRDSSCCWREND